MLVQNAKGKPKYEAPILVPLGEMTEASGACAPGSGDSGDCTAGGLANNACTAGPFNTGGTCSAGGSANPTCTGGALPG
jgi:hypothetical protein